MTIKVDFTGQSISWFKDRLQERTLVFKPPFQRNPVWLDKHKAYLVDTVLRQLPIPEVYIQTETDDKGSTIYSVVDGQQRLRALLTFPEGDIELFEKYSPGRGGHSWEDLSKEEKVAYWNYRLVVREISNASDAELRDLFQRLNRHTIVLNAQELRNARFQGDFIRTVTELADQEFWAENRIVSASEIRRMSDIEFVAELLVGLMHGPQNKKTSLDRFFEAYEDAIPDKQHWLKRFETARATTEALAPSLPMSRWRGKSDYYSLFLAVGELTANGRLNKTKKKQAIEALDRFGTAVTERLSKLGKGGPAPKGANTYAVAVEKAASDKDRRQTRHEVLTALLGPFFG